MADIQLLVGDDRNRELLVDALGEIHDVTADVDGPEAFLDAEFDLCVLDAAAFRGHREMIAERKREERPVFLPYLLLLGERGPDQTSEAVWADVDEVIDIPIARAALRNRVENLLGRRELSVELKRRQQVSERRFQTLFESTPDPIVVVTDDGVVTEVNDAFARLFDVEREAIREEPLSAVDVSPDDAVERVLLRIEDSERDPAGANRTLELESADGDTYVTELNVDVIEELGDVTERIGIFRDVTDREARQRELERQIEQLERFASIISHDLRNPLNIAQAKLTLLEQDYDDERLDEIGAVHDRMKALIEDVLELAKQGQAVGELDVVDLEAVVEAAWATVETGESAELRYGSELGGVEADEERLQALLENLFRNAVEHGTTSSSTASIDTVEATAVGSGGDPGTNVVDGPEINRISSGGTGVNGTPDVTVRVGLLDDSTGFYVEDDGQGIPEDDREELFEYGRSGDEDGVGLGLAIVDSIVEAHGWHIEVTEGTDGGARFEFVGV